VFGKDHKHVLEDIDRLLVTGGNLRPSPNSPDIREWFKESSYIDKKGEKRRMVEMTRDGFGQEALARACQDGAAIARERKLDDACHLIDVAVAVLRDPNQKKLSPALSGATTRA
jgi:hypothetical protein